MRAKAAGLYMICTISKHKAERKGYADAMMLDWQGRVAECTGANIFFIKDGKIHTPIADCFLDGITRRTVIDLARRRGIEVIERRIMPDELTQFSECFITGSAAEVTAVSEIAALAVHARRHHPAADGRLHRRGAAQGQGRGGLGPRGSDRARSPAYHRPRSPALVRVRQHFAVLRKRLRRHPTPDTVSPIADALCRDMRSTKVLNPGAPVGCERLRLVRFSYRGIRRRHP